MLLRKGAGCPTVDLFVFGLSPRGKYLTEAAFPTRVISGHTVPTGLALTSGVLRSGTMEGVVPLATAARPFIATSAAAQDLPALRSPG